MPTPRDNIQRLDPYTPGEQLDTSVVTKLNTNENPYPPSPKVMQAIRELPAEKLRVYPPPLAQPFRRAAAELHGLDPANVIATNGGDELLRLILTCYCEPQKKGISTLKTEQGSGVVPSARVTGGIGVTEPTYSLYPVLAAIQDTPVTVVERDDNFAIAEETIDQWNQANCRVGMIVNPHAPTGRFETIETLGILADRFNGLLLIDEAYVNFAPADAIELVHDGVDNVILLRSLSKGYSLAGLRFGYGLAHPGVITTLDKARDSYNTDALSQAAAVAAITDQAYAQDTWRKVIEQRERLTEELRRRGFVVLDSHSNFVLVTPPNPGADKFTAAQLYADLKARHLLVRYFNAPRLDDKLRITVGTPEQVDKLLDAIDELN
ncbi:MAG: pyridoxal phosphate-dependent aminotransferase [Phycisphaeraceae bacterium]